MMPELRKFFTEPQVVELVFTLMLAQALAGFDEVMGGRSRGLPPSSNLDPAEAESPKPSLLE